MSGSGAAHVAVDDPIRGYPRRSARTRRFTLGQPRTFTISRDGSRVAFLRSRGGTDPETCLWVLDVGTGDERLVADPSALADGNAAEVLPLEERARRERMRETAGGITGYSADPDLRLAAFALGGRLFVADLTAGETRELPAAAGVVDPRIDPTARRVGYLAGRGLHVIGLDGDDRVLAGEENPDVTWGLAEFAAAEEMGRVRGFWWAPDGDALVAARVDESRVAAWWIADPSDPSSAPRPVRYPAAGTENADVTLWRLGLDGSRTELGWDRSAFPYLARVSWEEDRPITFMVQTRDQGTTRVQVADPVSGEVRTLREDHDETWIELMSGVPAWLGDGRLVTKVERDDTHRLAFDGEPVTPPGLQVRRVLDAAEGVVFAATDQEEPTEQHLWRLGADGELTRLTEEPGVHDGVANGAVAVVVSASMDRSLLDARVLTGDGRSVPIASRAEAPGFEPRVSLQRVGGRRLQTALILPPGADPEAPLPVLMDPYGGPHFQRVVKNQRMYLESQWFAAQGFAVLVVDGLGTPGRGLAWEKSIRNNTAGTLDDQVEALHAMAELEPRLDLGRVAIRGWSFGGYLAALAVLRRPDVFHAAVAGAPDADQRLYDTHYTERYLGLPQEQPEVYRRNSLLDEAPNLTRPLMIIHGLADDNVVVAHSLQLSRALLEAGRPHTFLPLSRVTHMTPQEAVAENLLLLQVEFLKSALGM